MLVVFLKDHISSNLIVNGLYDAATIRAVKTFQNKHKDEILTPWGLSEGTGVVYKTTLAKINNIKCAELNIKVKSEELKAYSYTRRS